MTEEIFTEWKDQTRQEALEKEVKRLRSLTHKQSGKIGSLRKTVYFTYFFFIALLTILFFKGMISFPGNMEKNPVTGQSDIIIKQEPVQTESTPADTIKNEDAIFVSDTVVPIKNTKGTLYCIQIGAFTGIDLGEFEDNMESLQQDSYEGINQLTLGRFRDYDKAVRFLSIVHQIGFRDAFIMSFRNGHRVPLQEMQQKTETTDNQQSENTPEVTQEEIATPYHVPEEKPIVSDSLQQ